MARYTIFTVIGLGLLAGSLATILFALSALAEIGQCAVSPVYQVTSPCPEGTSSLFFLLFGAFFTIVIGQILYAMRTRPEDSGSPLAEGPEYGPFWWPALFLGGVPIFFSLIGGIDPVRGGTPVVIVFVSCGILFLLLGGVPVYLRRRQLGKMLLGGPGPRPGFFLSPSGDGSGIRKTNAFFRKYGLPIEIEDGRRPTAHAFGSGAPDLAQGSWTPGTADSVAGQMDSLLRSGLLSASDANAARRALEAQGLAVSVTDLSEGPPVDASPDDMQTRMARLEKARSLGLVSDEQCAEALAAIRAGKPYSVQVATVAQPVAAEEALPKDPVAGLERLAELHRSGALTDEEFSAAKADLLRQRNGEDR